MAKNKSSKTTLSVEQYRDQQVALLPTDKGVYALCDLDGVPIYVGTTEEGIRKRVQRHLTSARSDVIANRTLDIWEVAHVWAWKQPDDLKRIGLEAHLYNKFHKQSKLVNAQKLSAPTAFGRNPIPTEGSRFFPTTRLNYGNGPKYVCPDKQRHILTLLLT